MSIDYSGYFLYFNRSVLTRYRASPNIYEVEEDDMGGRLINHNEKNQEWYEIRFASRRMSDKRVCIAAFGLDIDKLTQKEKHIWFGEQLENPKFSRKDPDFKRWLKRNFKVSRDVHDGPLPNIKRQVRLCRALSRQKIGYPLWNKEWNELIKYPIAENTEAYRDAHLELFRLLVDELNWECLAALAEKINIELSDDTKSQKRRFNALKELLPRELVQNLHTPLKNTLKQRNKKHGISSTPIKDFPAFDTFHADVLKISKGFDEFKSWLENVFGISAEICLKRESAMSLNFPKFIEKPGENFFDKLKRSEIKKMEGKTIQAVEFGREIPNPEVHDCEAIIFHFTDGTSLAIRIGSNASDFENNRRKFKPSQFSTDLLFFWAPSIESI